MKQSLNRNNLAVTHRLTLASWNACLFSRPQENVDPRANSEVENQTGVEPIKIVLNRIRQPWVGREVDEITQQDRQEHSHPVVNHCRMMGPNVSCRDMAERIPIPELQKKLKGGKLVLVDVREASEIKESGAIPGAIHIPMAHIEKRMGELPKKAEIVFY